MKTLQRHLPLVAALVASLVGGWSGTGYAKTTDLVYTPPDLTTSVAPNIAVTFDDSGSMGNYYMGDTRPYDNKSWTPGGVPGVWMCAGVIDPRATLTSDPRHAAMNGVYYNPRVEYTPPVKADGSSFPQADATLAKVWLDGIDVNRPTNPSAPARADFSGNRNGSSSDSDTRTTNMLGTQTVDKNGNPLDQRWVCAQNAVNPFPDGKPYYYQLKDGVTFANGSTIDTAVLYDPANWEAVQVPADQYQNFANWFAYYRTRNLMTRTALSQAFAKIGNTIRVAWQSMNRTDSPGVRFDKDTQMLELGALNSTVRQDFYNFIFRTAGGYSTPSRAATIRAGELFRRPLTQKADDPYWNGVSGDDSADLTCRKNFHMLVTDGYWNETPDPDAPDSTNGVPALSASNVSDVAQSMPDTKSYTASGASLVFGNVNRGKKAPYVTSMANIAWYYWSNDLQPTLSDDVKPYWGDLSVPAGVTLDPAAPQKTDEVYWNPANDPATWQHVSQFFVTLGVAGALRYPDDLAALRSGAKSWPYPANNSPAALDDTWHGAVNSRGGYFSATDPTTLVQSLINIINSVVAKSSSAVSAPLNSGVLSANSVIYVPNFDSTDWTGTLTASPVATNGALGAPLWQAGQKLDTRPSAGRLIVTRTGPTSDTTASTVEFKYANLSQAQKDLMNSNDGTGSAASQDGNGEKRVEWVRGDTSKQGTDLRARSSVLGAIVNAQPVYVSYPAGGYRDYFPPLPDGSASPETAAYTADAAKSYSQFVADNLKRAPTVYTAANDGMLHAFDAGLASDASAKPGNERWAYIPASVYPNLWNFSKKDSFQYAPTVDATPIYRDIFFGNAWHTILVGGLRQGGRGIYALDITNPDAASASAVASKVLWEFNSSSTGGANLGFTYGQPNIGRLKSGKWVVLVPAGYFPTGSTAPAANNTYSSLFVLDAATGKLLHEFKTPTSVNGTAVQSYGLATPVLGDYNNDQVDDVAFAGDLVGNMWRFDLANIDDDKVSLLYKPKNAEVQPITVMPRLFPDPNSQYFIVVYGTGKFLGLEDRVTTSAKNQAVFGIRDPGPGGLGTLPITQDNLLEQDLTEQSNGARLLTTLTPSASNRGWFFTLDIGGSAKGERVVVTPAALFNTNRVIITSLIPTTNDPCNPGRTGAVMVVDATTGGAGAGVDVGFGTSGGGRIVVGARVDNPPAAGGLPAATQIGGGNVLIPGTTVKKTGSTFSVGAPIWRRRSWRILNDQ
jgi:type IV pilus assembly protein PilY1